MLRPSCSRNLLLAALLVSMFGTMSCKGGNRKKTAAAAWVDRPSQGKTTGNVIQIPDLGLKFEVPDTLYVFKHCAEAGHSPDPDKKWIPVITCESSGGGASDAPAAEGESQAEAIALTIYATHRTRPIDERSVAWFKSQYSQAGLKVEDIQFNEDYQKKSGIVTKLHVLDQQGLPSHEILQYMFAKRDIVFIARMEYRFGETRSVMQDWQYILWNLDIWADEAEG